jgi:hypothetical protein
VVEAKKGPRALRGGRLERSSWRPSTVEGVLTAETKKWEFEGATPAAGGQELRYRAKLARRCRATCSSERLRMAAGDALLQLDVA